ncbi:FAD-binding protein [Mycolicibacterium monacense]|uniref:3-ketosteroid-delta-1-dehydrogenase n=1 Tax=Mycolicibacterium monacense TaxID=85693 RepID=A0AAD1IY77_MYCMB|nr:FAD-binding protein [Mycolicibacterium monacense]MDA4104301.1 3-ketosteroid-delta-1-dehydrogenase [Mycolicibacterium monacense DSM 44395]ORB24747.1 3-ketosteroid-delta-1-dehydrogenase [Mycolicibacterium monacense DSM 44395]QHP84151.1 FAD-binding protein [Mycolicibacterium monacense DSM 44395]BBZ63124.1 3-ketosteroid-delta-1-dehydrogenase [Mycolicibacterium monacense]
MSAFDEEVDVVVVGSGGGVAGAYTAAREGLSVALVEATERFGGTTAYSGGGGMWFPCNPVAQRAGIDDSPEDALAYFHRVVGDRTPLDLQRAYVLGGPRLIEYLERDEHFQFAELPWPDYFGAVEHARADGRRHIVPVPLPAADVGPQAAQIRGPLDAERLGHPVPALLTGGRALIGRFLAALARFPHARTHLGAPLVDLVDVDGAVVGAVINRDGENVRVRARRGVLLAAGGFEQNSRMRESFGVPGRAEDTMGCPGNTGAAHRAAIRVGAATDLMDQAWWSPGLTHPDGRSAFALWFTGGIFVDQRGERFVNESAPYDRLGRAVIAEMDSRGMTLPFWMVYDDREGEVPPVKATNVAMVEAAQYRDAGLWRTADTLDTLADLIGVPAVALTATVARFNAMVAGGRDTDFGRGDEPYDRAFSGGRSPMVAIEQPPFHAAAFGVSDLGTKGGLRTDTSARVLDADGRPIPGLYAAGNTMAAVSGTTYPGGGNPIGASLLFSHLAAMDMAGAGPR